MCSHWFSYSQWKLPSESQYKKLQALFAEHTELEKPYADIQDESVALCEKYGELLRQYDDLKKEYQHLRRPFTVSKNVPYTDVWHYPPVPFYPGKHPCEKPAEMMKDIINASSREGDTVFDAFMGSGSSGKAALELGRKFIGIEMDEERFSEAEKALQEIKIEAAQAA